MVAETNQAYAASEVDHRLRLVERSEVAYNETGDSLTDLGRFAAPSDGHMDAVHALRDRVGADLVHLIVSEGGGRAYLVGAFGLTCQRCGGGTFAHELGHNMGLQHDRYEQSFVRPWASGRLTPDPAYGYVNQPGLAVGAARSRRWVTIMSYHTQCSDTYTSCSELLRFSNPRQSYNGDPLGVPFGSGGSGVTGPADAAGVLNATGPVVALWRDHVPRQNRPPVAAGTLPDRRLALGGMVDLDVSSAFVDPDLGDVLTYTVSSSAPQVVTARIAGAGVTLTAVGEGTATVTVTATDPGGLSAMQTFTVTVSPPANLPPEPVGVLPPVTLGVDDSALTVDVAAAFRDPDGDVLTYRASSSAPHVVTARAVGSRVTLAAVDAGTATAEVTATDPDGLSAVQSFRVRVTAPFTDDPIVPGETPVRAVHFTELRARIDVLRQEAGLAPFAWTDPALRAGVTPVRLTHLLELRAAVAAAYASAGRPAPRWTDAAPSAGTTPIRAAHLMELRAAVLALE